MLTKFNKSIIKINLQLHEVAGESSIWIWVRVSKPAGILSSRLYTRRKNDYELPSIEKIASQQLLLLRLCLIRRGAKIYKNLLSTANKRRIIVTDVSK